VETQDPACEESRFTFHVSRFTLPSSRVADLALLMVALIWGATFVMVKNAVATYPVFSFLALRFTFAALALLPVFLLRRNGRRSSTSRRLVVQPADGIRRIALPPHSRQRVDGGVLAAPLLMGLALFAGYALQTFGLRLTTPAKAGFITGLSVVIVPVVSTLLLRQPLSRGVWLGVGLATAGLALLSLQIADPARSGLSVSAGDLLVLGCAVAFACQILLTGRFAPSWDPLLLTAGQIVVVAVTAGVAALLLERPSVPTSGVLFAAAFTGILATSLAFGIQTVAQRFTSPTRTALVFATEPVFAALFSFLLIGEVLGLRQIAGCALILAGMITAETLRAPGGAA
jgi:drug/metabolite transporter (DMT)-like permease